MKKYMGNVKKYKENMKEYVEQTYIMQIIRMQILISSHENYVFINLRVHPSSTHLMTSHSKLIPLVRCVQNTSSSAFSH